MTETTETVIVIKPIHDATRRAYDYRKIQVPREAAELQLSLPDEKRNFQWQGVRFATQEETDLYYGRETKIEASEEVKNKPGRKPKRRNKYEYKI